MFGDYASNLMFLPNLTRRELLHFVAGGGLPPPRGNTAARPTIHYCASGVAF